MNRFQILVFLLGCVSLISGFTWSDAESFAEGIGESLIGENGRDILDAGENLYQAGSHMASAARDFYDGDSSSAWENVASAGGNVLNAAVDAGRVGENVAIDAATGAAITAAQAIPGVDVAVDAGLAAYKGYQIGNDIGNAVEDWNNGNYEGAGESATDAISGVYKAFNDNSSPGEDGTSENDFNGWGEDTASNSFDDWSDSSDFGDSGGDFGGFKRNTPVSALVEFYNQCNGENWLVNKNWLVGAPCTNRWWGVKCRSNEIVGVYLLANNVSCTHEELEVLSHVTTLTYLNLEGNQLTGSIPSNWTNLVNLQHLILKDNMMSGDTSTVCSLPSLRTFDIAKNNFGTNSLPVCLNQINDTLRYVDISENGVGGAFPASQIVSLSNLRALHMSKNGMTGNIPSVFHNFPYMRSLDLSHNQFEGGFSNMGELHKLHRIDLRNNSFSGSLQEFPFHVSMPHIHHIYFGDNDIQGSVPSQMRNLLYLSTFDTSNNPRLTGTIPAKLGDLFHLRDLKMNGCNYQGMVPHPFDHLRTADFSGNRDLQPYSTASCPEENATSYATILVPSFFFLLLSMMMMQRIFQKRKTNKWLVS